MGSRLLFAIVIAGSALHAQGAQPDTNARANLEKQVRERLAQVTQQRLGATDQQMAKLQATNQKYDAMRQSIVAQERQLRVSLRKEMAHPDSSHQPQVASLLDQIGQTQRQRLDIQQQEQQEMAGFLTPLQRARYFTLEQQIRQRVNQMRQAQIQANGGAAGRAGRAGQARARGRGVQRPPPPQ
jgi:hypothetical protein